MIPQGGIGNTVLQRGELTSRTYRIDAENNRIIGIVDGIDAIKQAVYKIMGTERFEHLIYGPDYGGEYSTLVGQSSSFIRSELVRRIQDALLTDDRITSIEHINVTANGDSALIEFTVVSQYGRFQTSKGIGVNV